jgi:hypothetical protein
MLLFSVRHSDITSVPGIGPMLEGAGGQPPRDLTIAVTNRQWRLWNGKRSILKHNFCEAICKVPNLGYQALVKITR